MKSKNIHFTKANLRKRGIPLLISIARLLLLIGISYTILIPLFSKLALVFMSSADLTDFSVKWVPKHFTLQNIKIVFNLMDYIPTLFKTIAFCGSMALIQVAICTLSAYGFARYKSRFKGILFGVVLATLLVPPQTYIVTLYTQFQYFDILGIIRLINGKGINVINTIWTFILLNITGVGIRSGLYIYVEKQTFGGLPIEIEEAAKVDGAGMFRTFWSVMLPNAVPTIVMCFILSFVWHWNDLLYTEYFYSKVNTLAVKFSGFSFVVSDYIGGWAMRGSTGSQHLMSVGGLFTVLPLIILFIFSQRFFVQGVERSGLVG